MAELFGRKLTRAELLARVGDVSQVGGVRLGELADGRERGVRVADFRTGTGFSFTVHVDRGLDIGAAEYRGQPLSFRSAAGVPGPAFYEPAGIGWVQGFPGGLVVTCGLTYTGAPCVDEGASLGLHGPASYTPAQNVWADGAWDGDDYEMFIQGKVRQAHMFGDKVELTRRISARLGESRLTIADRVANLGGTPAPHMIIYHCNFGFPLLDADAELLAPVRQTTPSTDEARKGLARWNRFEAPQPGYAEQVFYHDATAGADGFVTVALVNRRLGLGAYLRYRRAELPWFVEWKQMGAGDYVLGLEPANCWTLGRAAERQRGTLQFLQPGETRHYALEIGVLPDKAAIERLEREIAGK